MTEEHRALTELLKQVSDSEGALRSIRRLARGLQIVGIVAASIGGFTAASAHFGHPLLAQCCGLFGGIAIGAAVCLRQMAKQWPFICPHIDRASITSRLKELGNAVSGLPGE